MGKKHENLYELVDLRRNEGTSMTEWDSAPKDASQNMNK